MISLTPCIHFLAKRLGSTSRRSKIMLRRAAQEAPGVYKLYLRTNKNDSSIPAQWRGKTLPSPLDNAPEITRQQGNSVFDLNNDVQLVLGNALSKFRAPWLSVLTGDGLKRIPDLDGKSRFILGRPFTQSYKDLRFLFSHKCAQDKTLTKHMTYAERASTDENLEVIKRYYNLGDEIQRSIELTNQKRRESGQPELSNESRKQHERDIIMYRLPSFLAQNAETLFTPKDKKLFRKFPRFIENFYYSLVNEGVSAATVVQASAFYLTDYMSVYKPGNIFIELPPVDRLLHNVRILGIQPPKPRKPKT